MAATEETVRALAAGARPESPSAPPPRHLYGPVADVMLLGGASLIVLPLCAWLIPQQASGAVLTWTLLIAHFVNNPHFAASYQIFYRKFLGRAFGSEFPRALRIRYQVAGIWAPLALAAYFWGCIAYGSERALGMAVNLMFFLVGWHYVKQGFGMLMLDANLKRNWFNEAQKTALLQNGYAFWIFTWLRSNDLSVTHDYWGIPWSKFQTPTPLLIAAGLLAAVTTLRAAWLFRAKLADPRPLPIAGLVAYFASVYVWLFIMDPIVAMIIPAFHSLQYLAVVWKYESRYIAETRAKDMFGTEPVRFVLWMGGFAAIALALGWVGFWGLPQFLDRVVPYDKWAFSSALFIYMFWIFINVHHYALDSVMWRKENPDTRRYLFG